MPNNLEFADICPEEATRTLRLRAYMLNKQQKRHHSTNFHKNQCMKSNDRVFFSRSLKAKKKVEKLTVQAAKEEAEKAG